MDWRASIPHLARRLADMRHVWTVLLCWTVLSQSGTAIDGDTFDTVVPIWIGFGSRSISVSERVRVLGVDTPELTGATKDAALAAKAFTQRWLSQGPFSINACKRDAFGRVLGIVFRDGQILAEDLITAGQGIKR